MSINPADNLLTQTVNGWRVISKVPVISPTSGKYSTCYIVEQKGKQAFLKAFDYRDLLKAGGLDKFELIVSKFNREKNIVKKCKDKNISSVVKYIESGSYFFVEGDISSKVDYFITEYSVDGNVSQCLEKEALNDLSLKFSSLINIFDGVDQLHKEGIMHLDLKPSNLLYFVESELTKITDFGSARQWVGELNDDKKSDLDRIITTRLYAPPEVLYEDEWTKNWGLYRLKIDLFLLGNVIIKLFTNVSFTALLKEEVNQFDSWNNTQNRGRLKHILPTLTTAASSVYQIIEKKIISVNNESGSPLDRKYLDRLINIIKCLCNPDPNLRGHPKEMNRNNDDDGLYRFRDSLILMNKSISIQTKRDYRIPKI